MKKILGLSLIASATLLTLSASAKDLTEAIKDVDISGTVAYRYNDYEGQPGSAANATNNYKIATNLKSKVNDDVSLNTRFIVGNGVSNVSLNTSTAADSNVDVTLSEVNFAYTGLANTSIIIGKQSIDTIYTVSRDAMGDESTGTGIVAVTTLGPLTVFGAFFNQTNLASGQNDTGLSLDGAKDVMATGVMASFAGINLDASYIDYADTFDAYSIGLDASYEVGEVLVSPYVRYSALDLDTATTDNALWKAGISAQLGMFGAAVGYGETDKEGGVVGLDGSSATGFDEHWNVTLSNQTDADVLYASVNAQITDTVNLSLNYSDMGIKGGNDEDEIYTQLTYQMSSNFSTYLRLGEYDVEGSSSESRGRLHVQYSF